MELQNKNNQEDRATYCARSSWLYGITVIKYVVITAFVS